MVFETDEDRAQVPNQLSQERASCVMPCRPPLSWKTMHFTLNNYHGTFASAKCDTTQPQRLSSENDELLCQFTLDGLDDPQSADSGFRSAVVDYGWPW